MGYTPLNDPSVGSSTSKFKGKGRAKNQGWVDLERGGGGELTGQEAEKLEMVNEGWERLDESTSGPSTAGLSEYPPPLAMSEEEKEEKRIAEVRSFARSSRLRHGSRWRVDRSRTRDGLLTVATPALPRPSQNLARMHEKDLARRRAARESKYLKSHAGRAGSGSSAGSRKRWSLFGGVDPGSVRFASQLASVCVIADSTLFVARPAISNGSPPTLVHRLSTTSSFTRPLARQHLLRLLLLPLLPARRT